jgi:hypothetical protein
MLWLGLVCVPAMAAQIAVVHPATNDVIPHNSGVMRVDVIAEPPLTAQDGNAIRILLDGKPAAPDSKGTSFTLEGMERGEHWLQAVLLDSKGQTSAVSNTVYFTVWQGSAINSAPDANRARRPR